MFSHSLSNTGRAFREGLPYPYISIFTSCSKHVITTELRNETSSIASRAPEETSARSPAEGVCSVSALEAVVGMGRDPMGMLDPGELALARPRGTLSLPLMRVPAREGSQRENQSRFLVFHVFKGKPWAGTWTQTCWHLQRQMTSTKPFASFPVYS